tara:strand:+ start:8506 stop:8844 length:339 start_codon:yes stop_codon:yes gene_type:complete
MKYLILAIIMSIKTLASDELSERYYYKMEYVDDNTFRFEIKEKDCKKLSNADFDPYILVRECKEKKEGYYFCKSNGKFYTYVFYPREKRCIDSIKNMLFLQDQIFGKNQSLE